MSDQLNSQEMILHPIGIIKNNIKQPFLKAGENGIKMQGKMPDMKRTIQEVKDGLSEVILNQDMSELLEGIEKYSHLIILYWAHKVPAKSRGFRKIHPMGREDIPEVGIFSSCSPARPNPVLITVVKLLEKKGNVLTVAGLDAIDGSPVVDIKPYVNGMYPQENVVIADWMSRLMEEIASERN